MFLPLVSAMAQSQQMRYLQEQLTVEIQKTVIASYYDWDTFLNASTRIGGAGLAIGEARTWHCYKGGIKISEAEFYETAGLNEYAIKARSYKSNKDLITYGGILVALAGCGLAAGEALKEPSEINYGLAYTWLGVACVGLTFEFIGLFQPPKLTSASFAVGVADEHNRQLKKSFQE
jgi:hypothetical protein